MTIEEKLREMLIEHGMPEMQVSKTIEKVKALDCNEAMIGRWQHNLDDYFPSIMLGLWLSVPEARQQHSEQKKAASDTPPAALTRRTKLHLTN